jgi:hypothetical protein
MARISGERADHVGPKTSPMALPGDNDRYLAVAKTLDKRECLCVFGDVNESVSDALAIESTGGGRALNAGGLGIDGNGHGFLEKMAADGRCRTELSPEQKSGFGQDTTSERSRSDYGPAMIRNNIFMAFTPKQTN